MKKTENKKRKDLFRQNKSLIDIALKAYLKKETSPGVLRRAMEYVVFSAGKRLRPVLTMESAGVLGGSANKALPFACAIELVHNFSLIHDDLPGMDDDDFRRGRPACHKKFGEGLAILAGDAMLNLAFRVISKSGHKKSLEAISFLSGAVGAQNMIGGQALELECRNHDKRYAGNKIDCMKTAALMAASCGIGALAAEAKIANMERICEFGKNLGLAFQLADDIDDCRYATAVLKKMKEKTAHFINKAKKSLAFFGEKAESLIRIADSVLKK